MRGAPAIETAERLGEFQLSFEDGGHDLELVAHGPLNVSSVPVTISGDTVLPDASRQTGSAVGCSDDGGPVCELDGWLADFISTPLRMRLRDDALRLSSDGIEVDLRRDTGTAPHVDVNGRTLLTYRPTGTGGDAALLRGVLTVNPAGCVAVDDTVLIAPATTTLHADGSLTIGTTTLRFGSTVSLGGGTSGTIPNGSPCHETGDHCFTVANHPQPQPEQLRTPAAVRRAVRLSQPADGMIFDVMTVAQLKAAIQPALHEILTAEELASTSIRVTEQGAPLSSLRDEARLSETTRLQVFTRGESAVVWVDGDETPDEVCARVRSDLQDFVAESAFGWGQLRP